MSGLPEIKSKYKYSFNENFFKNLNDPIVVYWIGFIIADGGLFLRKNDNYDFAINLKSLDKNHLQNFLNDIDSNRYIYDYKPIKIKNIDKEYFMSGVTLSSKIIANDLIKLGCVPNKTKIGVFISPLIPKEMYRHFIRGYFDGDGSIGITKNHQLRCNFVGCLKILEEIRSVLIFELKVNNVKIFKRNNIYSIEWVGNLQTSKIYEWLYQDSTRFLERKFKIYNDFKITYKNNRPIYNQKEILLKAATANNWRDLFRQLGYKNYPSVHVCNLIKQELIRNNFDFNNSKLIF